MLKKILKVINKNFHKKGYWSSEYHNMIKLYQGGLSCYGIGKIYNIDGGNISSILKRFIKLRSRSEANTLRRKKENVGAHSLNEAQWSEIQQEYKNGKSLKKLAAYYKMDKRSIKKIISEKMKVRSWREAQKLGTPKKEQAWNWIKDRTKLKNKRCFSEELDFFENIFKKRNYTCELTGKKGKLSVHHIVPVRRNKELQFSEVNVIVILRKIHKKFHNAYGTKRCNDIDWYKFVTNKEYL